MDYIEYMKQELEKSVFIEVKENLTLDLKGNPVLKSGEYPILSKDLLTIAKGNKEFITPSMLIDGMIYIVGCDIKFKYAESYKEFLLSVDGIENYIIMNIEDHKKDMVKTALVFSTALTNLYNKKEYFYNRIQLLMDLYEKNKQEFVEKEILQSLNNLCELYPDFSLPHFHLGEYYLDKDIDKAKFHLRRCLSSDQTRGEAARLLTKIDDMEKYDNAVELIKNGLGLDALKILIPMCDIYEDNLDIKYYTAVALRQTGSNEKALIYLSELLDNAERSEVYSEIGLNLAELGDYEAAEEYFRKALKITPDDPGIICNIGVCQFNLLKSEEAKKSFELAARLNPKDEIAAKWIMHINKEEKHGK